MAEQISSELKQQITAEKDWHRCAVFTHKGKVITASKCQLQPDEIKFYTLAFEDRDTTVGEGFFVDGDHFDVHRFHPPLVYGRRGGPDDGEGIALCRVKPKKPIADEPYWYLLITYLLPILSAKAVPQMVKFSENFLGNPE